MLPGRSGAGRLAAFPSLDDDHETSWLFHEGEDADVLVLLKRCKAGHGKKAVRRAAPPEIAASFFWFDGASVALRPIRPVHPQLRAADNKHKCAKQDTAALIQTAYNLDKH